MHNFTLLHNHSITPKNRGALYRALIIICILWQVRVLSMARHNHCPRRNGFSVRSNIRTRIDGGSKRISPAGLRVSKDDEEFVVSVGERRLHLEESTRAIRAGDIGHGREAPAHIVKPMVFQ